jgi:hypothetical protein
MGKYKDAKLCMDGSYYTVNNILASWLQFSLSGKKTEKDNARMCRDKKKDWSYKEVNFSAKLCLIL